nr:hypothetical protein Iba_chr14aCG18500 [Ipomoea batatas]
MNSASGNPKQLGPLVRIPNLIHAYYAGEGSVTSGPIRSCKSPEMHYILLSLHGYTRFCSSIFTNGLDYNSRWA